MSGYRVTFKDDRGRRRGGHLAISETAVNITYRGATLRKQMHTVVRASIVSISEPKPGTIRFHLTSGGTLDITGLPRALQRIRGDLAL